MRNPSNIDAFEPIARGVAQAGVRIANERAVLTLIAGLPGSSNADIARRSGLGPQTTARILADFEARGLVERGQVLRGRRGQPATPYRLNPDGAFSIGVEIGWSHLEILLFSMGGRQDPTIVLVQYIYKLAFQQNKGGEGAAAATLLFAMIIILSVLQYQALRARGQK